MAMVMWMVAAIYIGGLTAQVGLVWGLAATPVLSLYSSNEMGKLSQWLWS